MIPDPALERLMRIDVGDRQRADEAPAPAFTLAIPASGPAAEPARHFCLRLRICDACRVQRLAAPSFAASALRSAQAISLMREGERTMGKLTGKIALIT